MKNQNLPFQIGEHYENWEFDLEVLDVERIKGYDNYLYLKEVNLYGFTSNYTELIFLFDILEQVILKLNFETQEQLNHFINNLSITKIKWKILELNLTITYGNMGDMIII
ncbi:hypothetical protein [Epilithonimonas vandammei]|uniref:Uncharacterized protein n=1 Tax=Epilithonimonas vandammei TaxID=2487072 RepID=A0A3G8XZZ3_9FLAO|nr:hypothetical protein [Epilithonimonas vandammei]AZI38822.1 hypothetical protein EIB74_02100 [Epilithonimonas vandammei]